MIGIATKLLPAAQGYETARQSGFRRVELWTDARVLGDWANLVPLGRSFGFDHAIHFPNRLEQNAETLRCAVELYRGLDCRAMVIHQPHFDRHGKSLLALDGDLKLGVENHKLDRAGFRAWAVHNPGLTLDVEHLWKYTLGDAPLKVVLATVKEFLAEFSAKLHHVHLPGYLPGQEEHRPMYCSRDLVLGVLSMLHQVDFQGLIVSEVNPEFQNFHDLRMDVLLFERWQLLAGHSREK